MLWKNGSKSINVEVEKILKNQKPPFVNDELISLEVAKRIKDAVINKLGI